MFFGSPIHHVGIYEGGGVMINAPETGENVRRDSIARADYAGAAALVLRERTFGPSAGCPTVSGLP